MIGLDRSALNHRNLSSNILKSKFKLNVSKRTVQKYMNLLGYRKIRRKTCGFVSRKNIIERYLYARFSRAIDDWFNDSIFIGKLFIIITIKNLIQVNNFRRGVLYKREKTVKEFWKSFIFKCFSTNCYFLGWHVRKMKNRGY